jgi:predicted DCC family thiol-disulfide oxidoreductase YuxK
MRPQLVTDGNCAFCQASAAWLLRHFPGDWVNTPNQSMDLKLIGITEEQANSKVWYMTGTGEELKRYSGSQAVAKLLLDQPKMWIKPLAVVAFVPITKQIAEFLYFLISKNRKHLGTCETSSRNGDTVGKQGC